MMPPIYLDHNATTPIDPRVLTVLTEAFRQTGNPSSLAHLPGRLARARLEAAAASVRESLGASSGRVIWTSGATEANNLAIRGVVPDPAGLHVLCGATEHASVLRPMGELGRRGALAERIAVARDGRLEVGRVLDRLQPRSRLLSVMLANNEIGVVHPVSAIAAAAREHCPELIVHCDATQALAHLDVDVRELGVDALSLSAHKVYGPVGIGVLWLREGLEVQPIQHGGGQQGSTRPGTVPVALAVACAHALALARRERAVEAARVARLRDHLWTGLQRQLPDVHLTGHATHRLPGNLHVWFSGVDAGDLLEALPGLALSTGAACRGEDRHPSHVIEALGLPERAFQSARFGLGRGTTEEEVDTAVSQVVAAVRRLRTLQPAVAIRWGTRTATS